MGNGCEMDHSSIGVLESAFHRFFAGLPRSENGVRSSRCSYKTVRDSPHRSYASRSRLSGLLKGVVVGGGASEVAEGSKKGSGIKLDVASDIPDKASELA